VDPKHLADRGEYFLATPRIGRIFPPDPLFQTSSHGRMGFGSGHQVREPHAGGIVRIKRVFPG
jgi:hypothetical protein